MTRGERIAAAALGCVGVRFRLHGRGADGLDCVGVVLVALRGGGVRDAAPDDYALRSDAGARVSAWLAGAGLTRGEGDAAGDVLLCRAGAGQVHLAVRVGGGVVHADAVARRVVLRSGAVPWPVIATWRLK